MPTFATQTLPLGKWEWDNSQEFSQPESSPGASTTSPTSWTGGSRTGTDGLRFRWDESEKQWVYEHNNSAGRRPLRIQTALATKTYGRASAIIGGSFVFGEGFRVGDGDNARHQFDGTGAPTGGEWAANGRRMGGEWALGDIVWNRWVSTGAPLGWVCVSTGTPGTRAEMR